MIRIKKYKNRHLYLEGQYITFKTLERFIQQGDEFVVYSHDTGLDVTNDTLKEMLVDKKCVFSSKAIIRLIEGN